MAMLEATAKRPRGQRSKPRSGTGVAAKEAGKGFTERRRCEDL
jgi:hypothetical protein